LLIAGHRQGLDPLHALHLLEQEKQYDDAEPDHAENKENIPFCTLKYK
jgi:hypothetical protein